MKQSLKAMSGASELGGGQGGKLVELQQRIAQQKAGSGLCSG